MSEQVVLSVEYRVKLGEFSKFRTLLDEMVDSTRTEEGTLTYEFFFSDESGTGLINERHRDSRALVEHFANWGKNYANRFNDVVEIVRMVALGEVSDDLRDVLAGFGAVVVGPLVGFSR